MSFSVETIELVGFLSYFFQELGVTLTVGGMSVVLVLYLASVRDGAVEIGEARLGRAALMVLLVGLFIMVLSGAVTTGLHFFLNQETIVFTPAFLFKWILIGVLAVVALLQLKAPLSHYYSLGFAGATWYALFILHVLAPFTSWSDLIVLYVAWVTGFVFVWTSLVYLMRKHANNPPIKQISVGYFKKPATTIVKSKPPEPVVTFTPIPIKSAPAAPRVLTPAPVPHKPIPATVAAPPPVMLTVPKPILHAASLSATLPSPPPPVPQKPHEETPTSSSRGPNQSVGVKDPDASPALPAIRVMPRTPEDVASQNRPSVVEFK